METLASSRVAHVRQVNRCTVHIVPREGYDVAVMVGAEIQAFIVAKDGTETVIMKLAPSASGAVEVVRYKDGIVDVIYPREKA